MQWKYVGSELYDVVRDPDGTITFTSVMMRNR